MNLPFGLSMSSMISLRFRMRVEGSAIREIRRSLGRSSDLRFVRIENQGICEDEKLYLLQGR